MKTKLAKAVLDAGSACPEFKKAAQDFLDAAGSENEAKAWEALVAEAKEDIGSIDGAIGFLSSDIAVKIFGEEAAKQKLESVLEAKKNGAVYCNCEGCAAAKAIIDYE